WRSIDFRLASLQVGLARGRGPTGEGGPKKGRAILAAAALLVGLAVTGCGGDPPQIVDYAPQRNTIDVSTAAPIRITFDHDVDQASVASRLRLAPATIGSVRWLSGRQLIYDHVTLLTNTNYEVILESGYRDPAGNTYTLRHHWSFVTEGPPGLTSSKPASRETGVDPSAYLSLQFSRGMDPVHLKDAISIQPSVPFDVKLDPTDNRRAIIAPSQLLAAHTEYQVAVNVGATDVDGNQLGRYASISFTTGAVLPLRNWIAFAADSTGGSPAGLWIVNDEYGFPRQLFDATVVHSFSWSPSGDSLLIQGQDESWVQFTPGSPAAPLTFKVVWAAALAAGMCFVYIDDHEGPDRTAGLAARLHASLFRRRRRDTHRDAAEGVRGQRGLAALCPQSYDRDSCRSRHRGRVAGLIARRTSDRVSQRRSGLADERGRHAPDRVDQRGPCLFSLFLPRACMDADLSSLDDCVEQVLETVRGPIP